MNLSGAKLRPHLCAAVTFIRDPSLFLLGKHYQSKVLIRLVTMHASAKKIFLFVHRTVITSCGQCGCWSLFCPIFLLHSNRQ